MHVGMGVFKNPDLDNYASESGYYCHFQGASDRHNYLYWSGDEDIHYLKRK
jgi:hypothetical protein